MPIYDVERRLYIFKSQFLIFNISKRKLEIFWAVEILTYRLAVGCVHAGFDLGMYPQRRPLLHGAQEEGFKVEENLIGPVSVPRWLVWNNCRQIAISAPETKIRRTLFDISRKFHFRLVIDEVFAEIFSYFVDCYLDDDEKGRFLQSA